MPVRSMGEETMTTSAWERKLQSLEAEFPQWEKTKDIVDQLIDLMLNYRQSGHPGGSRSKVHALLSLLLSGSMRFDLRHPDKTFNDRFVLIAGHTIPLVYAVLATLHESLRLRHAETGDTRFAVANPERWQLTWEDLLLLRRNKGLPGHAEFEGKTLFVRFNTGPSGHGFPPAVGMALALKRSGAEGVRVFAMEGEGGATAGAAHESMNSAWGLGLDNLHLLLDWNDYGIDTRPASSVVYGCAAPVGAATAQSRAQSGALPAAPSSRRSRSPIPRSARPSSGSARARGAATASTTPPPTARRTR